MSELFSEEKIRAWRGLLKAHATVLTRIEQDLAAANKVPLVSYDVLVELVEAPDQRLRMSELAERVVLSRSGLTRLVDRLEQEGLLTRERLDTDRRGSYAVLTPKGRQALREAWPVYEQGIAAYFADHLSEEEATAVANALERVVS